MPACDCRAKPTEDGGTLTKNMTKDEVIEKLKNRIQERDPAFRKLFLDFSKELNGKINVRDFKKVGTWVSLCFCVSFVPGEVQWFCTSAVHFQQGIYSLKGKADPFRGIFQQCKKILSAQNVFGNFLQRILLV